MVRLLRGNRVLLVSRVLETRRREDELTEAHIQAEVGNPQRDFGVGIHRVIRQATGDGITGLGVLEFR